MPLFTTLTSAATVLSTLLDSTFFCSVVSAMSAQTQMPGRAGRPPAPRVSPSPRQRPATPQCPSAVPIRVSMERDSCHSSLTLSVTAVFCTSSSDRTMPKCTSSAWMASQRLVKLRLLESIHAPTPSSRVKSSRAPAGKLVGGARQVAELFQRPRASRQRHALCLVGRFATRLRGGHGGHALFRRCNYYGARQKATRNEHRACPHPPAWQSAAGSAWPRHRRRAPSMLPQRRPSRLHCGRR